MVIVEGKVAVVTGAGRGIGAALAGRLVAAGASVVVADLDGDQAQAIAASLGKSAVGAAADVCAEAELRDLLALAERHFGPVDVFCANAGIIGGAGLGDDDDDWARAIDVNLMAHVRAAQLLLPGWLERGSGYFVATASAAGLLAQIGLAPYSVTKHAAVAFAEWLSLTYGDRGIAVSCLCPMGVNTDMIHVDGDAARLGARVVAHAGDIVEPEDVADCVLEAMVDERFLILPHPEVLDFYRRKGADHDRWLRGMRRLRGAVA